MKFPVTVDSLDAVDMQGQDLHLAIGMFDGVHTGHQSVVEAAIHAARNSGSLAGVLTFWPHPSRFFCAENATPLLMEPEQKAFVLHRLGIDIVVQQAFDGEIASVEAGEFVNFLKEKIPTLAGIYVGDNFRFGKGRLGDSQILAKETSRLGIHLSCLNAIEFDGSPISSTRIRAALVNGRVEEANRLLGYTYFCHGVVQSGQELGRKLGFPTLNVGWAPELKPRYGVYAVEVQFNGKPDSFPGVANYGVKPTVVKDCDPLLEVHLFEDPGQRLGETIRVEWRHFLRSEKHFETLEALSAQIQQDKEQAAGILGLRK